MRWLSFEGQRVCLTYNITLSIFIVVCQTIAKKGRAGVEESGSIHEHHSHFSSLSSVPTWTMLPLPLKNSWQAQRQANNKTKRKKNAIIIIRGSWHLQKKKSKTLVTDFSCNGVPHHPPRPAVITDKVSRLADGRQKFIYRKRRQNYSLLEQTFDILIK